MKITLIQTGKTKEDYLKEGLNDYHRRLKKYIGFQEITIPDLKNEGKYSPEEIRAMEGENVLKYCRADNYIVLWDERGNKLSSSELAKYLQKRMNIGRDIAMIIGGAYGFSDQVYKRADDMISLSNMTFSHQMVRLIIAEQLYRAMTIIRGEPYHHA